MELMRHGGLYCCVIIIIHDSVANMPDLSEGLAHETQPDLSIDIDKIDS